MSRILAWSAVLSLVLAGTAFAQDKGPGCGLGKSVFGGQSGLFAHVLAATTNGTSGNQTFGMTSGTSGCDTNATVKNEREQSDFIAANMPQLINDLSRGNGEFLAAYGQLLGCSEGTLSAVSTTLHSNYDVVTAQVDVKSILSNTKKVITETPSLAGACSAI